MVLAKPLLLECTRHIDEAAYFHEDLRGQPCPTWYPGRGIRESSSRSSARYRRGLTPAAVY